MSTSGEILIEPGRPIHRYWRDLWRYRELFYFMAWRDVLLRYRRTSVGFAWAVLRPFLTMLVFTLIFSKLARLPSGGAPYPILVYTAILPWQFFATAFQDAGNSLSNKETIISKVYFPRLIIPASAVFVSFLDFLAAGVVLAALMIWYGFLPDGRIFALPVFIALVFLITLGAGLWIAALSVKYKDFRYVTPFVVQMGLYISPIGFSSSLVPEPWRALYALNPMVGVIEGFRWAVLGVDSGSLERSVGISAGVALVLLLSGILYFRKIERSLAEIL